MTQTRPKAANGSKGVNNKAANVNSEAPTRNMKVSAGGTVMGDTFCHIGTNVVKPALKVSCMSLLIKSVTLLLPANINIIIRTTSTNTMAAAYYIFQVIRVVLIVMFMLAGTNKVTDLINKDMHDTLRGGFTKFVPIWQKVSPITVPPAETFMFIVGASELTFAVLLLTPLLPLAALGIVVTMCGAMYTHVQLSEPFTFPLVLSLLALALIGLDGTIKQEKSTKKD